MKHRRVAAILFAAFLLAMSMTTSAGRGFAWGGGPIDIPEPYETGDPDIPNSGSFGLLSDHEWTWVLIQLGRIAAYQALGIAPAFVGKHVDRHDGGVHERALRHD